MRGSPQELGFVRSPGDDGRSKVNPGWEVWRTPEGVLITLPPGCESVLLREVKSSRGITLVIAEPPGAVSLWPKAKRQQKEEEN